MYLGYTWPDMSLSYDIDIIIRTPHREEFVSPLPLGFVTVQFLNDLTVRHYIASEMRVCYMRALHLSN